MCSFSDRMIETRPIHISTGFCFIYFEALKTIKYKGEMSVDCII